MTKRLAATMNSVKGYCAAEHKPGDRTSIGGSDGLSIDGYICPTAMYPMLCALKHGTTIADGSCLEVFRQVAANVATFQVKSLEN